MQAGHWGGPEGHGLEPVTAYCQEEGDKSTKEVHQRELLLATPQQLVAALIQEGRLMANSSIGSQSVWPTLLTCTMLELAGWVSVTLAAGKEPCISPWFSREPYLLQKWAQNCPIPLSISSEASPAEAGSIVLKWIQLPKRLIGTRSMLLWTALMPRSPWFPSERSVRAVLKISRQQHF